MFIYILPICILLIKKSYNFAFYDALLWSCQVLNINKFIQVKRKYIYKIVVCLSLETLILKLSDLMSIMNKEIHQCNDKLRVTFILKDYVKFNSET